MRWVALVLVTLSALALPRAPVAAEEPTGCGAADPFVGVAEELASRYPGRHFTAAVVDDAGCAFALNPHLRITTASVVKVEIMAGVLLRAQREGRALTANERRLIAPMVAESANAPASQLFSSLGGARAMEALDDEFGMVSTSHPGSTWGLASTSASDQVELMRRVVAGHAGPLSAHSRGEARGFLAAVVPSQRWGASAGLPPGFGVFQKNGFAVSQCCRWRLNTVAWVERPDGTGWALALLSDGWSNSAEGTHAVHELAGRINRAVARVPVGHLDQVTGAQGSIRVTGWAADPDDAAAATVHLYLDGQFAASVAAEDDRPDVGVAYPRLGSSRGFSAEVAASPGTHRLCAYAINSAIGPSAPNPLLGCADVAA